MPLNWIENGTVWMGSADFSKRTVSVTEKRNAYSGEPQIEKLTFTEGQMNQGLF